MNKMKIVILLSCLIFANCAVNKNIKSNQQNRIVDSTYSVKTDSTILNSNKIEKDNSTEDTEIKIEENISEIIADTVNRTSTQRTVNKITIITKNKKNDIVKSDTISSTSIKLDTLANIKKDNSTIDSKVVEKESQSLKWIMYIVISITILTIILFIRFK